LEEEGAIDDNLVAGVNSGAEGVLIAKAIAQPNAAAGKAAIGFLDVDKWQVVTIAQYCRDWNQKPSGRIFVLDPDAHIHQLLEKFVGIVDDDAYSYRACIGIDHRRNVVNAAFKKSTFDSGRYRDWVSDMNLSEV
jgi:hypothetical protein